MEVSSHRKIASIGDSFIFPLSDFPNRISECFYLDGPWLSAMFDDTIQGTEVCEFQNWRNARNKNPRDMMMPHGSDGQSSVLKRQS